MECYRFLWCYLAIKGVFTAWGHRHSPVFHIVPRTVLIKLGTKPGASNNVQNAPKLTYARL
jgi:hypothetical protein